MDVFDLQQLKTWFLSEQRDLPWRQSKDPYAVWVSEIMLQQTQVSVVIPYFLRWMHQFPTIKALADSPIDDVLKAWEGLGYYSRARQLHAGAQFVTIHFNGVLPDSEEQLSKIKGLGPYTVGAILSFAFHKRVAAVDGNVLRVIARYDAITEDISKSKTIQHIRARTQALLPAEEAWIISEALIELGATLCSRKPKCMHCPLKSGCQAYLKGMAEELPIKAPKAASTKLYRAVMVCTKENEILIAKGAKGKVMADLYEFPYIELGATHLEIDHLIARFKQEHHMQLMWQAKLPTIKHRFTRYEALLEPHLFKVTSYMPLASPFEWHSLDSAKKCPFSSGHKKILYSIEPSMF